MEYFNNTELTYTVECSNNISSDLKNNIVIETMHMFS